MIIDHVGIVVKSIKKGIKTWQTLFGYRQTTEMIINTRQKVKVVFMSKDDSLTVKLLETADATSPVFDLSRRGGGLHHPVLHMMILMQNSSSSKNQICAY